MTLPFDGLRFRIEFGKRLRELRDVRRVSQLELAGMLGCTYQTISNLERGLYMPSLRTAFALSEALEVHPRELLFGWE
jgi:transcriptional regulator with XRE-family HTH domain